MPSSEATDGFSGSQATAAGAHLLDVAIEAAEAAASEIRAANTENRRVTWEVKAAADFVTDVDRAAEARIARVVRTRTPEAVIQGEELSPDAAGELVFVADPLDGTTNFLHGYPEYAVSIAAVHAGQLVAAVVLNVPTGERFTATSGGGAFRDGVRIAASEITDPARALLGTGFPFKHPGLVAPYLRQFEALLKQTSGIRRAGSASLDLADVACGRFEGFWELMLAPWDIAAGILLVREAGGIITDLRGAPAQPSHTGVVAGNPAIHPWLLQTFSDSLDR